VLGKHHRLRYTDSIMTDPEIKRSTKRPAHLDPPKDLAKSPPVPVPEPMIRAGEPDEERLDPVRYGDWEYKGIAIDF
jgi:hypothetical protein